MELEMVFSWDNFKYIWEIVKFVIKNNLIIRLDIYLGIKITKLKQAYKYLLLLLHILIILEIRNSYRMLFNFLSTN